MTRFDRAVWSVLGITFGLSALLVWRGDRVGLQMQDLEPAAGARRVSTQAIVRVAFTEPLEVGGTSLPVQVQRVITGTTGSGPISGPVSAQVSDPVTGTVRWEGAVLAFVPSVPLAPDTAYRAHVDASLTGADGRRLLQPLDWSFTTGRPRVLYMDRDEQNLDQLYAVGLDGGAPEQMADESFGVWDYAVSPDGMRILFTTLRKEGGSDMWLMNADGTGRRKVFECPSAECSAPAWSPDGTRAAFERRNLSPAGGPPGLPRLWWLQLATGDSAPLFADSQKLGYDARWSADGRWLSFVSPDDSGLQVYNAQDGQSVLVPSQTGQSGAWHPKSNILLATNQINMPGGGLYEHIVKVDVDETVAMSVTAAITGTTAITATRAMTKTAAPTMIAESTGTSAFSGTMTTTTVTNTTTSSVIPATPVDLSGDGAVDDGVPSWSPDGTWIAFTRRIKEGAGAEQSGQLWLMRPDGSEAKPLTAEPDTFFGAPSWSPDGRYLLFQRIAQGRPNAEPGLYLLDLPTGVLKPLVARGARAAWLP